MKYLHKSFENVLAAALKEVDQPSDMIELMTVLASVYVSVYVTIYKNMPTWTKDPSEAGVSSARHDVKLVVLRRLLEITTIVRSAVPDVAAAMFTDVNSERTIEQFLGEKPT